MIAVFGQSIPVRFNIDENTINELKQTHIVIVTPHIK